MPQTFPPNLWIFGAGKVSLGKNISTFEEYIPLHFQLISELKTRKWLLKCTNEIWSFNWLKFLNDFKSVTIVNDDDSQVRALDEMHTRYK